MCNPATQPVTFCVAQRKCLLSDWTQKYIGNPKA